VPRSHEFGRHALHLVQLAELDCLAHGEARPGRLRHGLDAAIGKALVELNQDRSLRQLVGSQLLKRPDHIGLGFIRQKVDCRAGGPGHRGGSGRFLSAPALTAAVPTAA
jgi:hypothetical protein